VLKWVTDIKTRHGFACELREMIDTAKDEALRAYTTMIPILIQILRTGEAAFKRETIEFQFRRVLLEILARVPFGDSNRQQSLALVGGLLFLLRHDNEENAVTCCKTLIEITRALKTVTDETVQDFIGTFQDVCRNMAPVVQELLSDDSPVVDPNTVMPSIRSFRVLGEIGAVVVTVAQYHRGVIDPGLLNMVPINFNFLALESTTQKKAREDFEAMGGVWAGPAPNLVNPGVYAEFNLAQCKVSCS
jgi:transformation/transcription domain-associated protein